MKFKYLALLVAAVVNSILYVNCSGFKGTDGLSLSNLSSISCREKVQASAESKIEITQCENIENYKCERRIFSPSVENSSSDNEICGTFEGLPICVMTHLLSFNTEAARTPDSDAEFSEGGEFNREDFQCIYNLAGANTPLFQALGESVMDALSNAVQLCRERAKL